MYESTQDAMWGPGIDLAQEADFDLGALRVRPARCSVEWNGVSQTLQRRVMQVLVALAQARGSVVSQTDLVARCWRGLSVTDDAIYRCISKLRKLAADYPDAPYAIEAIPGVGYRLTASGAPDDGPAIASPAAQKNRFRYRASAVAAVLAIAAGAPILQRAGAQKRSCSSCRPSSSLSERKWPHLDSRAIFLPFAASRSTPMPAPLCLTARISMTCSGRLPCTSTRFSKALGPPTFR